MRYFSSAKAIDRWVNGTELGNSGARKVCRGGD